VKKSQSAALASRPVRAPQRDPGLGHAPALLADLLALVVGEGAEEIRRRRVAGVAPVELHAGALEQPGRAQRASVGVRGEEHVQRRDAGGARRLEQRAREARAHGVVVGKQARPRRRREWHRREELRVVLEAVALVGVGPAQSKTYSPRECDFT
jgi:hypothetical protein